MFFQSQLCKAWRLAPRIVRILSIVEHPSTALQLFSETRTIRKSGFTLDIQTSNGFAVSSTNASVRINELGINLCVHVVDDPLSVLSWGLKCYDLEQSISWPPRGTVKLIKGHRVIECHMDNFVTVVAVAKIGDAASKVWSNAEGGPQTRRVQNGRNHARAVETRH